MKKTPMRVLNLSKHHLKQLTLTMLLFSEFSVTPLKCLPKTVLGEKFLKI